MTPRNNNTNRGAEAVIIMVGAGNERESQHMAVTAGAMSLKHHSIMKRSPDQKRR